MPAMTSRLAICKQLDTYLWNVGRCTCPKISESPYLCPSQKLAWRPPDQIPKGSSSNSTQSWQINWKTLKNHAWKMRPIHIIRKDWGVRKTVVAHMRYACQKTVPVPTGTYSICWGQSRWQYKHQQAELSIKTFCLVSGSNILFGYGSCLRKQMTRYILNI
jgi:hypothetical protein